MQGFILELPLWYTFFMKVENKRKAIILLLTLIAIGGIVMYGGEQPPRRQTETSTIPKIKGPTTPPPGYEAPR